MMEHKDCQIKFRLTEQMKAGIEALAAKKDTSASQIIREAVRKYLEEEK